MQELKILKAETGEEIASRCYLANRFFSRLKGLLGKEYMSDGEGLLISPCSSVHTMGMKICIDVVFLSSDFQVLRLIEGVRPGKVCQFKRGSSLVLDLPAGQVRRCGLKRGDFLIAMDKQGDEAGDFFSRRRARIRKRKYLNEEPAYDGVFSGFINFAKINICRNL